MNKRAGLYAIVWATLLILFNVIAFVLPGYGMYTDSFWIGYVLITVTFIGQLICAFFALKETNATKLFYRISLMKTSYSGLVATFIFGGLCMLIALPYWISIILCSIILVVNVISVVKTVSVIDEVERIDCKIKEQTFFIKSLTRDAESLMARAKSNAVKAECKKVYEAIRYSDPMSNDALASMEGDIAQKLSELVEVVASDDSDAVAAIADEVIILLGDRSEKCRLLK